METVKDRVDLVPTLTINKVAVGKYSAKVWENAARPVMVSVRCMHRVRWRMPWKR